MLEGIGLGVAGPSFCAAFCGHGGKSRSPPAWTRQSRRVQLRGMASWVIGSRRLEGGALRNNALRNIAPQGNEQLAGQGHNSDTPDPSLRGADPIAEPAAQGRVRLMTQPKPGEFDHHAPQAEIARLWGALAPVRP